MTLTTIEPNMNKPLIKRLVSYYDTTDFPEEAFFVLPNGEFLDGSGRKMGNRNGGRALDHHEVGGFLPPSTSKKLDSQYKKLLYVMKATGMIRFDLNAMHLSSVNIPNMYQIYAIIRCMEGEDVTYDLYNSRLELVASEVLEGMTKERLEWFVKYPDDPLSNYEESLISLTFLLNPIK